MNHPPTVILDRYPNGAVIRVVPEHRSLWLPFCWIGGATSLLALFLWSPETGILLLVSLLIAIAGARLVRHAAQKRVQLCIHTVDSAHGLEDVAEGYAVLRCACGANRRIVRTR